MFGMSATFDQGLSPVADGLAASDTGRGQIAMFKALGDTSATSNLFVAPETADYTFYVWSGGAGGRAPTSPQAVSGNSASLVVKTIKIGKGVTIPITVGRGGITGQSEPISSLVYLPDGTTLHARAPDNAGNIGQATGGDFNYPSNVGNPGRAAGADAPSHGGVLGGRGGYPSTAPLSAGAVERGGKGEFPGGGGGIGSVYDGSQNATAPGYGGDGLVTITWAGKGVK